MKNIDTRRAEVKIAERRTKEIDRTPPKYRGVKERAFDANASPREAIKAFCLHCVGDSRAAVRNCTSWGCLLREYRPYQTGDDDDAGEPS